jgi:maleylacetate reductase
MDGDETSQAIGRKRDCRRDPSSDCRSLRLPDLSAPFKEIVEALGERCVGTCFDVTAHGPRECVISGSAAARLAEPDLLLAIGGGSAIDAAKLMLLCLRHDITKVDALDAYGGFPASDPSVRPADEPRWLRLVAIPTTLSAAEFTWFGGAHDAEKRVKDPYGHPMTVPQAIILDPATTLATPLPLFLSTGMKAVDHAAEHLASLRVDPLTEALAVQALRLLSRGLPQVWENPTTLDARLDCQIGMSIAMVGPAAGVGVGASHAIGHVRAWLPRPRRLSRFSIWPGERRSAPRATAQRPDATVSHLAYQGLTGTATKVWYCGAA